MDNRLIFPEIFVRSAGGGEYSPPGVCGGFSTRLGGVSGGTGREHLASLNLGYACGDDPECVAENYRRIALDLGLHDGSFVYNRQVHGNTVLEVTIADLPLVFPRPEADAMITREPGVILTVFTADCVPVLLYDPVKGVIGAAHAGWRGTANGVVTRTVTAMTESYGTNPADLLAAIGPCIGSCCFVTDYDVPAAMYDALGGEVQPYIEELNINGRYRVDIAGINKYRLTHLGVLDDNIELIRRCTCCESEIFWSHRKTKGLRGSQAGFIMLSENG